MNLKQMAGEKAVEWLEDGMTVGLGTGSTAYWAIKRIGELAKGGLSVKCVATSVQSEALARECGLNILDVNDVEQVDLTIDGADEVDPEFNLIKGGGGALLREKIVASLSKSEIIVVDGSKMVEKLNVGFPLPVEVAPFGWERTKAKLEALGCTAERRTKDNAVYKTDNGNFILD